MRRRTFPTLPLLAGIGLFGAASPAALSGCRSEAAPEISFVGLADGAKVKSPLEVCMAVKGVQVEPAGEVRKGYGHHHILVDVPLPADLTVPIPKDEAHIHMGDGSVCKTVTLSPGPHVLRTLFADGAHIPYDPLLAASVKVEVEP